MCLSCRVEGIGAMQMAAGGASAEDVKTKMLNKFMGMSSSSRANIANIFSRKK